MSKERFFKGELFRLFKVVPKHFVLSAFAEEGGEGGDPAPTPQPKEDPVPTLNYEELIKKARKEEKDKLYGTIQSLKAEVDEKVKLTNDLLLKNAALSEALDKVKNKKNPDVERLESENADLKKELEDLKSSIPNEDEIRSKLEKEYEVKLYAQEQKEKNKGKILTMLLDDIGGSTKEEVDAGIQSAIEKTKSVKKDLGILDEDEDDTDGKSKPKEKGKTKTTPQKRVPSNNPSGNTSKIQYDLEEIRNMDPRSEEYKKLRESMGLR